MTLTLKLWLLVLRLLPRRGPTNIRLGRNLVYAAKGEDCDLVGMMRCDRFAAYADLALLDLMWVTRVLQACRKQGWTPVIIAKSVQIFRPVRESDTFVIRSEILGWKGPCTAMEHCFMVGNTAHAKVISVGRMTMKGRNHPSETDLKRALSVTQDSPELPDNIVQMIEAAHQN